MSESIDEILNAGAIKLNATFAKALLSRVKKLQKQYKIKEDAEYKGSLYKDTGLVFESVIHNIIYAHESQEDQTLSKYAKRLTFHKKLVSEGCYDLIISEVLKKFAEIDFKKEKTIDFN